MRRFEEVPQEFKKFPNVITRLPERSDAQSAGYDFCSKEDYVLGVGESHIFWTDVCAKMFFDNALMIYAWHGLGCKHGIVLRNGADMINASQYGTPTNFGNIGICLINRGIDPYKIHVGDQIAVGVFSRYLIVDDDKYHMAFLEGREESSKRTGGFGSSGR